jgi:hypothetical protein
MKAVRTAPERAPEHEFEAALGLPEPLPAGERILWQGQPSAGMVATRIFHLRALGLYFAIMLAWRVAVLVHDGASLAQTWRGTLTLALLALIALGILGVLARLTARTTVYTLTDQRVVMRIGIVLTVTYNLPLRQIDGAHFVDLGQGRGEIALQLREGVRIAYLHLWPHARPWRLTAPQPMLRCLSDARSVSQKLSQAWSLANAQPARPIADTPLPGRAHEAALGGLAGGGRAA